MAELCCVEVLLSIESVPLCCVALCSVALCCSASLSFSLLEVLCCVALPCVVLSSVFLCVSVVLYCVKSCPTAAPPYVVLFCYEVFQCCCRF